MSEIRRIIGEEIRAKGVISLARFMELALYCPEYGFYEREADTIGRAGDYYTSVSVGPLFGELLAWQFAGWLEETGRPPLLVEGGAHDGRFALDILNCLSRQRPELDAALSYVIIEPSRKRQAWQQTTLCAHDQKLTWIQYLPGTAEWDGIIFCNELLDAFPVHRFEWRPEHNRWVEWGVGEARPEQFAWAMMPETSAEAAAMLPSPARSACLPAGYFIEASPAALGWWRSAAKSLRAGRLVAVDYGLSAEDRLAPERQNGTLRSYRNHRADSEVLEHPGAQDITAHVDFEALQRVNEEQGLRTVEFATQGRFLGRIGAALLKAGGQWDPARVRQFHTLTHPSHLGHSFKVLVQQKA